MSLESRTIRKKYSDINEFLKKESKKHKCACGCKQVIELKKSHYWNGIPRYIFGHAARLRIGGPTYDKKLYYSVKDIAQISGSSEQTVRLWMRSKKITASKIIGRKNLFDIHSIDQFLKFHPKRKPFTQNDYVSVKELKKMGVSRSKLRALVRDGKVTKPRIYARKTHYLRDEIDKYGESILEERKTVRPRSRIAANVYKELTDRITEIENRISEIERSMKPEQIIVPAKERILQTRSSRRRRGRPRGSKNKIK